MAVIVPSEGRKRLLEVIKTNSTHRCALFKNNLTPDVDSELADFTIADFSGFGEVNITWGAVTVNDDDNGEMTGGLVQFVHDGGATSNDIYGYLVYDIAGGANKVIFCERFSDAPRSMAVEDDEIDITPRLVQGACI